MEAVPDLYQREVLGEVVNTTQDIFTKESIDNLKKLKPLKHVVLTEPVIFTAIDPAGGKLYLKMNLRNVCVFLICYSIILGSTVTFFRILQIYFE